MRVHMCVYPDAPGFLDYKIWLHYSSSIQTYMHPYIIFHFAEHLLYYCHLLRTYVHCYSVFMTLCSLLNNNRLQYLMGLTMIRVLSEKQVINTLRM